jgi:hypothetical protein
VAKDKAWVDIYTIPGCGRVDSSRERTRDETTTSSMVDMAHRGAFRPLEGAPAIQRLLSPGERVGKLRRRLFCLSSLGERGGMGERQRCPQRSSESIEIAEDGRSGQHGQVECTILLLPLHLIHHFINSSIDQSSCPKPSSTNSPASLSGSPTQVF